MATSTKLTFAEISAFESITEEEFVEFYDEDTRAEYVDGRVIMHTPKEYWIIDPNNKRFDIYCPNQEAQ